MSSRYVNGCECSLETYITKTSGKTKAPTKKSATANESFFRSFQGVHLGLQPNETILPYCYIHNCRPEKNFRSKQISYGRNTKLSTIESSKVTFLWVDLSLKYRTFPWVVISFFLCRTAIIIPFVTIVKIPIKLFKIKIK